MKNAIIDDGYVLHRFPYRETSVIVDGFLQHHGRMSFVAKGVRTERSSLKGVLQPFAPLHFILGGKGQLKTLSSVEASGTPLLLQGMPLMCAWYVNELLIRLLPKEEAHAHLYFMYSATLLSLSDSRPVSQNSECQKILRLFEKDLLTALGYQLPLTHDADSHRPLVYDHYYRFIIEHGFVEVPQSDAFDVFLGEDLQAIAHDQFSHPKVLQAAKRLFRLAIHPLLGGKPLKTRALFAKPEYRHGL